MTDRILDRPGYLQQMGIQFDAHPVVTVLGPRQCGKTTFARMYAERFAGRPVTHFDLEDPTHFLCTIRANRRHVAQGLYRHVPGARYPEPRVFHSTDGAETLLDDAGPLPWSDDELLGTGSFGVSDNTIRRYLDLLCSTFMVRQLPPWHENIKKRQVKAPKIYVQDSGVLHTLLGVDNPDALHFHPKIGPSWEGLAIETIIQNHGGDQGQCYFWSAHGRAELDLVIFDGSRCIGFEIKHTGKPGITRSLQRAREDLKIDEAFVVYPGKENFPLAQGIDAVGLETLIRSPVFQKQTGID